jgi:hypothetical protein
MGRKSSFDSDNKKDISGQWGEPVKKMLAKKYDMVMDPAGKVMKVNPESFPADQTDERLVLVMNMLKDLTTVTEPPKKGEAGFFQVLPEKTPVEGDTWTSQSAIGEDLSTTSYKILSITDSLITIGIQTNGKSKTRAEIMGMESVTILTSITTGTILVNRQTGIIRENVEDAVLRPAETDGKPRGRRRLLAHQGEGRAEKRFDFFILAVFGFQADEQTFVDHFLNPPLSVQNQGETRSN